MTATRAVAYLITTESTGCLLDLSGPRPRLMIHQGKKSERESTTILNYLASLVSRGTHST